MNNSDSNKYLIVKAGVVLTPYLDSIAVKLDPIFAAANHVAFVTSGIRTSADQLRIIKDYLKRKKITDEFIEKAEVSTKVNWKGQWIYSWQMGWSRLLNAGVIINPPIEAEVLLDYVNRNGENKKGKKIPPSVHFHGKALDIGGAENGIGDETAIIKQAISDKLITDIVGTVIERENNCLHLDLKGPA